MPRCSILFALLVVSSACMSSLERTAEVRTVALYTTLKSGGDAPTVQSIVFFTDGTVRLSSAGQAPRWAVLEFADRQDLDKLLASRRFRESVAALPRTFACCDAEELAISFEKSAAGLGTLRNPPTAVLSGPNTLAPEIQSFLSLRDRIGRRYFGRHYWPVGRR